MIRKKKLHPIEKNCREFIRRFPKNRFLVALSGGADSVATLRALLAAGADVEATNCNFHLRGEESNRDSQFCQDLCNSLGIRLHSIEFDTYKYIEEHKGVSLEMACRTLRHDYFDSLVAEYGFTRIATGHNADDNAETLFLNLLRGSGSRGLRGMLPDNGRIIRPLLQFHRAEILDYLSYLNQDFVTDSTNLESDYRRNFLRNEVFPLLRRKFSGFDSGIARSINILGKEEKIINSAIADILIANPSLLPWNLINEFPDPATLIFYFISPYDGSTEIAEEIAQSLPHPLKGKIWKNESYTFVAEAAGLCIVDNTLCENLSPELVVEKYILTDENREEMKAKIMSAPLSNFWSPYPPERYELRPYKIGERMAPLGMKGTRLISDIISDAKLTYAQKQTLKVLADRKSGDVIWIPGIKRSRLHLIDFDKSVELLCILEPSL